MLDAKKMSDAIRMKRKQLASEGLANMVDTKALPQMNPQDVLNLKHKAQIEETLGLEAKSEAPSDPADADISGTSQDMAELKRKMARVSKIFSKLG